MMHNRKNGTFAALMICLLLSLTPDAHGLDFSALTKILRAEGQVDSVIIYKDGIQRYRFLKNPGDEHRIYNFYSVAKSVTSVIAGIAVDEGYVPHEHVPVMMYLENESVAHPWQEKLTLAHLLSMTSGISWPESTDWQHFFRPLIMSPDWIDFILARDMESLPGTRFNYNTGNHHLVSRLVQDVTGTNMFDYAREHLFDVLGMETVSWYFDPQGVCFGGAWISMSAEDAVKIGLMLSNGGVWKGRQVVSKEWIDRMFSPQSKGYSWDAYTGGTYGYGFWINDYRGHSTVFAWGAREQYIFITRDLGLVAVFNSSFTSSDAKRPPYLYAEYVVAAIEGD